MVYIRKLLLYIRKLNSNLNEKQKIVSVLCWLVAIGIGIAVDSYISFNYFTNVLRAAIALTIGFYSFSLIYLTVLYIEQKRNTNEKITHIPIKERLSYKQRLNISVVLWGVLFTFALIGSKENPFFTFFSSLIITSALGILSFVRSTRDETQNAGIGFEDPRDVLFEKVKEEELKKRNEDV